jgi:hypothetical protein
MFLNFWLKDAKGQVTNTVFVKITVTAKETGKLRVSPSFGGSVIEKALQK